MQLGTVEIEKANKKAYPLGYAFLFAVYRFVMYNQHTEITKFLT